MCIFSCHMCFAFLLYFCNLQFAMLTMIMRRSVAEKASRQQMAKARSHCKWPIAALFLQHVYRILLSYYLVVHVAYLDLQFICLISADGKSKVTL